MAALEQLGLIWIGVFLAAVLAHKTRLTPVLYYLAIGSFLANVGLLPAEQGEFIRGFADVGIVLIMFALGFEENATHFMSSVKRSWGIAFFGAVAPFLAAFGAVYWFWGNLDMALISGLAMTATAVSLTMVSLRSEGLNNTPVATAIMSSAILDDIASLALVAVIIPVAAGDAAPNMAQIAWVIGKAAAFFGAIVVLAQWILPNKLGMLWKRLRLLDRWGIRILLTFGGGRHAVLAVLLLAVLIGLLAKAFGLHPAVGAYMAGLILKEDYFKLGSGTEENTEFNDVRRIVDNVAFTWIGPVFFVSLGSQILFDPKLLVTVIPQTLCLLAAMLVAQIGSAAVAARYTGSFEWRESMMIGFGMLGRAELAFVVLDIAYVQQSIITADLFYALMITIFWLNVAVPLSIAWWKPYYSGAISLGARWRGHRHNQEH